MRPALFDSKTHMVFDSVDAAREAFGLTTPLMIERLYGRRFFMLLEEEAYRCRETHQHPSEFGYKHRPELLRLDGNESTNPTGGGSIPIYDMVGNRYDSIRQACEEFGISHYLMKKWLDTGTPIPSVGISFFTEGHRVEKAD